MQNLPDSWVDALFARMAVRYGATWIRQWEGVDIAAVKADWARELGGFAARPEAITHALEHLPTDRPPTVGQFLALCRNAPVPAPKALPAPPAKAESIERAKALSITVGPRGTEWATELRRREQAGARLTPAQRAMWREALAAHAPAPAAAVDEGVLRDAQDRSAQRVRDYAEQHGIALGTS